MTAYTPRKIEDIFFSLATRWLIFSLLFRLAIFAFGTISVMLSILLTPMPFAIAAFTILAELCAWRSDTYRGIADNLLRKLDTQESFGWPISNQEMSDILIYLPSKNQGLTDDPDVPYFASKKVAGLTRALENLQESAWWSKHLAKEMSQLCLIATIVATTISFGLLIFSIEIIQRLSTLSDIARLATSIIVLVFSMGIIRFALGYYRFSGQATKIEYKAKALIDSGNGTEIEAARLWHDYQLSRNSAPMIPKWLWRIRKRHFNNLWNTYRSEDQ